MKLIGISGSSNERSYNKKLLTYLKNELESTHTFELINAFDYPLFTTDKKLANYPAISQLSEEITQADGIIISTGEHSRTVPPALKSLLEWLSTDVHPFEMKPVMIIGASYLDQGTSRAQLHLRQVLEAPGLNAYPFPGNEFLLGNVTEAFDDKGELKDPQTKQFLLNNIKKFTRYIEALKLTQVPEEINFKPGTYNVEATGHNGQIPMAVTFSDNQIVDIEIDTHNETEGIATIAFERTPQAIIDGQTLNVDAVSGASVTSNGIISGVSEAVIQAGADPEVLKQRPKGKQTLTQQVETLDTDVVVVGAGGAGLAAAASALEKVKDVTILEKFPMIGGNTTRTGGPLNAADPEWQTQFSSLPGEELTLKEVLAIPEETIHAEYREDFKKLKTEISAYIQAFENGKDYLFDSALWHEMQTYLGGRRKDRDGHEVYGDYDLVHLLTEKANETVDWLEQTVGVAFDREHVQMPVGANWRRGHKPQKNEGYAYIDALSSYVEKLGGHIYTDTKVEKLINQNGEIKGVEAVTTNNTRIVVNAKAVVLAAGGFGANTKMVQKYNNYWDAIDDDIATTNSPSITGDGIGLGQQANAALVDMGFIQLLPTCDPETGAIFTGIQVVPANFMMINQQGKRFVNEYGSRDEISKAAIANGTLFYLVADQNIKETALNTTMEAIDKQVAEGKVYRADTLAELAEKLDIAPEILETEVAKYNQYVDEGYDPEFGKNVFDLKIEKAPFFATPRKPAIHHTMGGLKINTHTEVLDMNGQRIPGLYAVGEVAGGIHAGNRLGGNALADIFTFGRITGKEVTK